MLLEPRLIVLNGRIFKELAISLPKKNMHEPQIYLINPCTHNNTQFYSTLSIISVADQLDKSFVHVLF